MNNENTIIKSKKDSKIGKLFLVLSLILLVASVIYLIWACGQNIRGAKSTTGPGYHVYTFFEVSPVLAVLITIILVGGTIVSFLTYLAAKNSEIIVEKDNVYGYTLFGKRVDLPMDSISAIGTAALKSIAISTSSGVIKFCAIENVYEVKDVIVNLVKERQKKTQTVQAAPTAPQVPLSNADELKKYKDLLDSGIISQEEFDAKKKQLLGL